jgi:hypothetical protein
MDMGSHQNSMWHSSVGTPGDRGTKVRKYTGLTDLLHRGPVSIMWRRLIGKAIRIGFATAGLPGV